MWKQETSVIKKKNCNIPFKDRNTVLFPVAHTRFFSRIRKLFYTLSPLKKKNLPSIIWCVFWLIILLHYTRIGLCFYRLQRTTYVWRVYAINRRYYGMILEINRKRVNTPFRTEAFPVPPVMSFRRVVKHFAMLYISNVNERQRCSRHWEDRRR